MNTKELLNVLKSKDRIKHVKSLLQDKKYDEIYSSYGQTIYNLVVPKKHKKADIDSLFAEGRFEDIYHKYGANTYNKLLSKMREVEVFYETGSKPKSIFQRLMFSLKHKVAPIFLSTTLLLPSTFATTYHVMAKNEVKENSITYAEDIEKYNNDIQEYASEVRNLNLNDLQTIMKVMSDMWERIDGYGNAEESILGLERIVLYRNGVGDCEHLSDDTTAILNAINPEYNARNLCVYMSPDQTFKLADIDRTIVTTQDGNEQSSATEEAEKDFLLNVVINSVGNHQVTVMDLPDENITLVLDPTNPGIGVYKNGKIYMFSTDDGTGISPRPLSTLIFKGESVIDVTSSIIQTFLSSDKSIEELREIYGPEALNKILEEVKEIEEKQNSSSFDQKYKIDSSSLSNPSYKNSDNSLDKAEKQSIGSDEAR